MFNKDKFLNQFIRKADGIVWDLMSGSMGVLSDDGESIFSLEKDEDGVYNISENLFANLSMPVPAFATKTPLNEIKEEDLIFINGKAKGWITKVKKPKKASVDARPTFDLIKLDGTDSSFNPPKTSMAMGFTSGDGAMILKPLISLAGDKDGLNSMQSQLMPLMLMGGSEGVEEMLPMMLMMNQNGMSGDNNMLQTMMMMKMLNGKMPSFGSGDSVFD